MKRSHFLACSVLALVTVHCLGLISVGVASDGSTSGWTRIATNGKGNPKVGGAIPVIEFKGRVYFYVPEVGGSEDGFVPAPVWTYDGKGFQKFVPDGLGDPNNRSIIPSVIYRGDLYAGTVNSATGGQLRRSSDGRDWSPTLYSDPSYDTCIPLGVQDGRLLVGFTSHDWHLSKKAVVLSYDGTGFVPASTEGLGVGARSTSNGVMLDGKIHIIAFDLENDEPLVPLVYKGGTEWVPTARPGFGDSGNKASYFITGDGRRVCCGTANEHGGGEVWVYDGSSWRKKGKDGMGSSRNNVVFPFSHQGKLYVTTTRLEDGPRSTASIYRQKADGSFVKMAEDGFGDSANLLIVIGMVFQGDFLAGTLNPLGFQVWRSPTPLPETYYFAEGTTRDNDADGRFDEWLCIQNPGAESVTATVTYMPGDGSGTTRKNYTIPSESRVTVDVRGDVGSDRDVSVKVNATGPIVAERTMYFNYRGKWTGGHVVMGVPEPARTWYFAEGTTRDNPVDGAFEEWLCIQNPNSTEANVRVTYMLGDGSTTLRDLKIPAMSRHTVDVKTDVGKDRDVSVELKSDAPVVAERPMYFNYRGKWDGGHSTAGATAPSREYFFAEGCTYSWNQEWLCIQNPDDRAAAVTLEYQVSGGEKTRQTITVPATSRYTVDVAAGAGPDRDVSVSLESTVPVVAEQPLYFNYQGKWPGGHDVMGARAPRKRFYFAEGTTRQNETDGFFEEWLCIQNPGDRTADVKVVFMRADGAVTTRKFRLGPSSRTTLSVNELLGPDVDASVYVESDCPVVAERPMYFLYHNEWPGGSSTIGATY